MKSSSAIASEISTDHRSQHSCLLFAALLRILVFAAGAAQWDGCAAQVSVAGPLSFRRGYWREKLL